MRLETTQGPEPRRAWHIVSAQSTLANSEIVRGISESPEPVQATQLVFMDLNVPSPALTSHLHSSSLLPLSTWYFHINMFGVMGQHSLFPNFCP